MIEVYAYWAVFFTLGVILAGTGFSVIHSHRQANLRRLMEAQLRESEKRASRYRDEAHRMQQETVLLREGLERAKKSGFESLGQLREQVQKKVMAIGFGCAVGGLVLGSVVSGVLAEAKTRLYHMERMIDLQVMARTAQAKSEMLDERLGEIKKEYETLRRNLFLSREKEAVAMAKLEVLLDQLVVARVKNGLMLDVEAMRSNIKSAKTETFPGSEALPLARPAR